MSDTDGTPHAEPPAESGPFEPSAAARLLEQTRRTTTHELEFRAPWLALLAAVVMFGAFLGAWLSVRGQHPYRGPTPLGLCGLYLAAFIRVVSVSVMFRRATIGVSGRSMRRRRAEAGAVTASLTAVYVVMGALAHAGAPDSIVYGVYVGTATLLVLGAFGAARAAAREDQRQLGLAIAILVVAAAAAFAGPRGVWLADGIGLGVVLVAYSAVLAFDQRGASPA